MRSSLHLFNIHLEFLAFNTLYSSVSLFFSPSLFLIVSIRKDAKGTCNIGKIKQSDSSVCSVDAVNFTITPLFVPAGRILFSSLLHGSHWLQQRILCFILKRIQVQERNELRQTHYWRSHGLAIILMMQFAIQAGQTCSFTQMINMRLQSSAGQSKCRDGY